MSDGTPLTGGCLCGRLRYRIDGPVLGAGICHCRSCRRAAGAESVAWLTVARDQLRVEGQAATFASSPGVSRGFCPVCGTGLTFARDDGDSVDVTLASLDDPESVRPRAEWWLSHRLSWNPANPALEAFAKSGATS
jgi:hypothetical protein